MHLIRMLRVSDTFTSGEEIPMGRYRVVGVKSLPRFSRARPAVRDAIRPGCGPCPIWVEEPESSDGSEHPIVEEHAATDGGGARAFKAKEQTGGEKTVSMDAACPPGEGWIFRLVRWLGDWLMRRRNPFVSAGPRVARTVVPRQGCLKLDGVQVVRNDLSDTDFEVVPVRRTRRGQHDNPASVACSFHATPPEGGGSAELRVSNL